MKRDAFFSSWFFASAATLGVALVIAASAAADTVSCTYSPGGAILPPFVSAQATPTAGGATNMGRLGGTGPDIIAQADNGTVDCGRATINNTALMALGDASPQGAGDLHVFYIPVGASAYFAPGFGDEPGSSDEIEFGVAFGGGKDTLGLDAAHGGGPATIRLGTDNNHDYINLNAAETTGVDQDVSMEGVDRVHFQSSDALNNDDDVRGIGGAGTGDTPFPIPITTYPGGGDDLAVGGNAGDLLGGDAGGDTLIGKGGDDNLWGGVGADKLFGGNGPDDVLGMDGADTAYGGKGADMFQGGPGADDLKGGAGDDIIHGGPGFDTCVGNGGKDSFTGCEAISN
jgi:Ca2+-binding RTX toxin-like protein